jgi:nitroimidazol reductase NimA-like FMN-containing flavoprotein (pyridoxamine 5'-phosphate oxidase superfamily)
MAGRTWLIDLPETACVELLERALVGRLGVVIDGRPEVFPVCHVLIDGDVLFATNEGSKMQAALAWPWVAFEVDEVEAGGRTSRSVMVSGHAEHVTDASTIERAVAARTTPWRTGPTVQWIRIVPERITGRQIDAEDPIDAPPPPSR